jgi:hypothetical protein
LDIKLKTLDGLDISILSTVNSPPLTFNYQLSTDNLSTINGQLSTIKYQVLTVKCQLSTFNCQLSTVICQLSTITYHLSIELTTNRKFVQTEYGTLPCITFLMTSWTRLNFNLQCQLLKFFTFSAFIQNLFSLNFAADVSSTVNWHLSTVNCQLSTVNCQLSTVNYQLSTVNSQLSTIPT